MTKPDGRREHGPSTSVLLPAYDFDVHGTLGVVEYPEMVGALQAVGGLSELHARGTWQGMLLFSAAVAREQIRQTAIAANAPIHEQITAARVERSLIGKSPESEAAIAAIDARLEQLGSQMDRRYQTRTRTAGHKPPGSRAAEPIMFLKDIEGETPVPAEKSTTPMGGVRLHYDPLYRMLKVGIEPVTGFAARRQRIAAAILTGRIHAIQWG